MAIYQPKFSPHPTDVNGKLKQEQGTGVPRYQAELVSGSVLRIWLLLPKAHNLIIKSFSR
jgi:hypothetical protein